MKANRIKNIGRFRITSYLHLSIVGLSRLCDSPSSHSSFCEEVFSLCSRAHVSRPATHSAVATSRMRWTGQIFWLLAYDACAARTFFPPSPPKSFWGLAHWEVVSSYSSATAPDSHGISCADPLF